MLKGRLFAASAVVVAVVAAGRQAQATTITFDAPITNPGGIVFSGPLGIDYRGNPSPNITLTTQGFNIGGVGTRPDGSDGTPDLLVIHDPTRCPADLGTTQPCASNGTHYLAADRAFSLMSTSGGLFELTSLDAGGVYGPGGCPLVCNDPEPETDATQLEVRGYRGAVLVADQILALTFGFRTFSLNNDPDWARIDRAVFLRSDPATEFRTGVAIDNINATPVPEPATLTLTALGLAGALRARRRRRS